MESRANWFHLHKQQLQITLTTNLTAVVRIYHTHPTGDRRRKVASLPTYRTYQQTAAGASEVAARQAASTSTSRRDSIRAQAKLPSSFQPVNSSAIAGLATINRSQAQVSSCGG